MLDEGQLNIVVGLFVFCLGASIGSFLNVVAYRVPLGVSLVTPASSCPACQAPISAWALIPVFGFFLVRGKCRACKENISPVYPIVECVTGVLTVLLFFKFMNGAYLLEMFAMDESDASGRLGRFRFEQVIPLFSALWLLYTGIPLSVIDLRYRILPDVIVLPGTLVAFVLGGLSPQMGWVASAIGLAVGSLGLFAVAKSYELLRGREGLGFGDVKYLALIGALVGWQGVIWTVALASCFGALIGIAVGVVKREGMQAAIPFGPFLAAAGLAVFLWFNELQAYFYGS